MQTRKADVVFKNQWSQAGTLSGVDPLIATKMVESGDPAKDKVNVHKATIAAAALKPSQTTMVLEKAVGMAINMLASGKVGGDLQALISSDNYIMDGHHRWAAAIIAAGSSAKVTGYQADLKGPELLRVLNVITVGKFGIRNGKPGKGALTLFTPKNIEDLLTEYTSKGIQGDFPVPASKVQEILTKNFGSVEQGISTMASNIKHMKRSVPSWAPDRKEMPVIDPDKNHVLPAVKALVNGEVDIFPPHKMAGFKVTASQRAAMVRLAATLAPGSNERRAILTVLKK
jgi:hypothetical protein